MPLSVGNKMDYGQWSDRQVGVYMGCTLGNMQTCIKVVIRVTYIVTGNVSFKVFMVLHDDKIRTSSDL